MLSPALPLFLLSLLPLSSASPIHSFSTNSTAPSNSTSPSSRYSACQLPKPQGQQLQGCPNGTLYVSQTDPQAKFGTIGAALAAVPANSSETVVILIGSGSYNEVVNITTPTPLHLLGITSSPQTHTQNTVHLFSSSFINQTLQSLSPGLDNADAATLIISPSRNASLVGSGPLGAPLLQRGSFKEGEVRVYNVDVANRAVGVDGKEVRMDTGPSAALIVAYANASFYQSSFASYQDTVYIGRNGSAYFSGGEVKGSTDYLYGFGTAYFQNTTLSSRGSGGGIVAWKGSEQWYGPNTFGAYLSNVSILPASDPIPSLNLTSACALGRPWNNQSRVVYMDSYMSDIVLPKGFVQWSGSDPRTIPNITHFIEAGSYGPGWNALARANNSLVETVLDIKTAREQYNLEKIFGEAKPGWIDEDVL